EPKVCASAQASYELTKDPGLFTVTCTANPATYNAQAKILENLDGLMAQFREKPPTDAELKRARNQAKFAYFAECDGPYRAGFHLGYFDCLDKWQSSYTWAERIRAVSATDVNRVAKKYFSSDARVVGWIAGAAAPKAIPPKASNSEPPKEHEKQPNVKVVEHARLTGYKENDSDSAPNQAKTANKKGIPAVIRDIPQALGNAVTGNIPGAVGNVGSAIINLPGAIGNLGSAVGNTAQAIGKQIVQLKPGPESEAGNLSHRVLKNGINVIVFETHVSPVMQISGSVQAGDAYSSRNNPGFSLLAASVLSQGSARRSHAQIVSTQDELGVASGHMLKFDSGIETIDFSTRCLSRDLPAHMDMIAESLSQPLLDEANLDKAKQDALSALKRSEDGVSQKVDRVLLQGLLDENSPFCPADPNDKAKAISQADLTETQKFFANHVVPGATTIVFAGDYNADQVYALAERSFGKWTGKGSHNQLHAKARVQHVLRSTIPIKDSKKSNVCFGQIVPMAQSHPEYGSLLIADSILVNHPMFSRFEQALSKTPALEAAISSGDMSVKLDPVSNLTRWSLSLSVEPSAVPLSVKTIKNELRLIAKNGVTAEEFTEVKRYLLGSLPVRTQATLGAICSDLLDSAEHSDTVNGYGSEIASIKAASIDSVNKVIRSAFKPELSTVVIAGGAQSIKAARSNSQAAASDNDGSEKAAASQNRFTSPATDTKKLENSSSDSKVKK
ncbi:MAG: insulinase family protein, partial [Candidatus Obscuribacterales bacterium]|nr:insulinase family protein [Candidatus Obscuribacterales bacterium]